MSEVWCFLNQNMVLGKQNRLLPVGHLDTSAKKARIPGHLGTGGCESTVYIDSTTGCLRSLVATHKGGPADSLNIVLI